MSMQVKLKNFSVGFAVSVWFEKEIEAESLQEAYEKAKAMSLKQIISPFNDHDFGCNDYHVDIVHIHVDGVLEKHGF